MGRHDLNGQVKNVWGNIAFRETIESLQGLSELMMLGSSPNFMVSYGLWFVSFFYKKKYIQYYNLGNKLKRQLLLPIN